MDLWQPATSRTPAIGGGYSNLQEPTSNMRACRCAASYSSLAQGASRHARWLLAWLHAKVHFQIVSSDLVPLGCTTFGKPPPEGSSRHWSIYSKPTQTLGLFLRVSIASCTQASANLVKHPYMLTTFVDLLAIFDLYACRHMSSS